MFETASVLAIDLGKTSCRVALWSGSHRAEADVAGAPGLAAPNGAALAEAAILASALPLLRHAGLAGLAAAGIGAAGALAAPEPARTLASRLLAALPAKRIAVTSDAVTAHAGAFAGAPGVLLAVGTGTVAVAVGPEGGFELVDGWGPWLGDEGGGAWLGLAGLRAALRATDGRGPATALGDAARARFGGLHALPSAIEGEANPARIAASFASDVVRVAEAGDAVAAALLARAGCDLAATTHAAASRLRGLDPVPLVLAGGLLGGAPTLLETLRATLAEGPARIVLRSPAGDALDGARMLALRSDTIHEARLVRATLTPPSPRGRGGRKPSPSGRGLGERWAGNDLDTLATEGVRPGLDDLDERPVAEVVRLLLEAEADARAALARAVPQLAAAAERVAGQLAAGGRLFYLGAGTPGRLAVLDAAELGPTFNAPPGLVTALIAGGEAAMTRAIEGAEDDDDAAAVALRALDVSAKDLVVGITASGRTPYVIGGLRVARDAGALTVAVVNNPASPAAATAELAVELLTGPEVIAGSTRLTAGTTQKIALNALSTAVMVRLGKTYGARMVDVRATNAKLRRRAFSMVRDITGADESTAERALAAAEGRVKPAIVALLAQCDVAEAWRRLEVAEGRVRAALRNAPP